MWKGILLLLVLATVVLVSFWKPVQHHEPPQIRGVATPVQDEAPTPQPTLNLSLDSEGLLKSAIEKEKDLGTVLSLPVGTKAAVRTPDLGALSQVDVTMTDKKKPIVHYYIAGKPEQKNGAEEKH